MRFEYTPSRFKLTDVSRRPIEHDEPPTGSRYTHILVPTSLALDDRPVLTLGLELAALHRAMLTVLHIRPARPAAHPHTGLDAIALLSPSTKHMHKQAPSAGERESGEQTRLSVKSFFDRMMPEHLRTRVNVSVKCHAGIFADTIAHVATEAAADVVVISAGAPRWWLPILPAQVRRLMRISQQQIILVQPDSRSRRLASNWPAAPADT